MATVRLAPGELESAQIGERDDDLIQAVRLEETMAELEQLVGFHVSLANTTIKAHFQRNFGHLKLTQKQIALLWLVEGCPGIVQVDIARLLKVKRATISAMVRALARRGLIFREDSVSDGRHVPLRPTEEGKAVLVEAKAAIEEHERWVQDHFSASERDEIRRLMNRLYGAGSRRGEEDAH